jgi:hypothetical protein
MSSARPMRQDAKSPPREPFRTLRGWAIGVLLETHAIRECDEHGHMRDRTDPDAWRLAREIASKHPFRGRHAGPGSPGPRRSHAVGRRHLPRV